MVVITGAMQTPRIWGALAYLAIKKVKGRRYL